jgi:hypothetical protein
MDESLTRAALRGRPVRVLRSGAAHKADLSLVQVDGETLVLKDYRARRGFWRYVVGVIGTYMECRALKALDGVRGVPQFRGRPDRYSVVMTYLPGDRASRKTSRAVGNVDFIRDFQRIVNEMHERGVIHLDLKHRSNLMVGEDGRAILLDFESAVTTKPGGLLCRALRASLGAFDRLAVLNWQRRLCPASLSPDALATALRMRRLRRFWLFRRFADELIWVLQHPRNRPAGKRHRRR